jgi:uncharacterized membrane protein YjgN (DUF898 family)
MTEGTFDFKGTGLSYLWVTIWTGLLTVITLGLLFPVAYAAQQRWIAENTFINGKQLVFQGSGLGIFVIWLKILLFSILTLGLYAPWGWCRIKRWQIDNLYFASPGDIERF